MVNATFRRARQLHCMEDRGNRLHRIQIISNSTKI